MSRVIAVDGLGKKYIIRHQQQEGYTALRDVMAKKAIRIGKKMLHPFIHSKASQSNNPTREEFWALKDISFEIKQGERVGIIGRNGAGKSTLLKLLSRITEPTTGRIVLNGRVASLLEVGTGFHPELTGRENIFLNGAVLGMGKAEIKKKFDEIVAFAEIEKFLDTPVKRYSSGMYVRLAFAVAAHLEPEILLVDEVLAVGDAAFQKKCLGKMETVGKEGRTVIFVSHQMDMIRALCERCVLLSEGKFLLNGKPEKVIETYLSSFNNEKNSAFFELDEDQNLALQVIQGKVVDAKNQVKDNFDVFDQITVEFKYIVHQSMEGLVINFELKRNGATLFLSFDTDTNIQKLEKRELGLYKTRVHLPCPLLKSGKYSISVNTGIVNSSTFQHLEEILIFEVELLSKPSSLLSYAEKRPGMIAVPLSWHTNTIDNHHAP